MTTGEQDLETATPKTSSAEQRPAADADELIRLEHVSVNYKLRKGMLSRSSVDVLAAEDVSLSVRRGYNLGLVGGTGSGKSTIAQVVMGMVKPTSGKLLVRGRDVLAGDGGSDRRRSIQVVLQDPFSSLDGRMKAGSIIAEPIVVGRLFLRGATRKAVKARVTELLGLVGLPANRADRYPHQFSGGQRQRIAIARALASRPDLIVLDEPTSALDVSMRAQILTLLKDLHDQLGVTYLVISHDLVTVAYLASDVAVMYLGRIVERGPTTALYRSPRHPYTLELLASAPRADKDFLADSGPTAAPTTSAAPGALPSTACRYAPRCGLRARLGNPDRCVEEDPMLIDVGPGHEAACHFADQVTASNIYGGTTSAPSSESPQPRPTS